MFDLMKIIIPKIMNGWEYVFEAFFYDNPTIKAIKERECADPKKCSREFFILDWLQIKLTMLLRLAQRCGQHYLT